jgi:type IV pilus assembly protein PilE
LVTVVIIGILAGIAYPAYNNHVSGTQRSDATINLTRIARLQVGFFTECGRYAGSIVGAAGSAKVCANPGTMDADLSATGETKLGQYKVTVVVKDGLAPLLALGGGGFTLTATPAGAQAAADGAKCATIFLDEAGVKGATGTDAVLGPNGGKCWKK